jgi:hypothetical protein
MPKLYHKIKRVLDVEKHGSPKEPMRLNFIAASSSKDFFAVPGRGFITRSSQLTQLYNNYGILRTPIRI